MYVRMYVCMICAAFINSPAKARGKGGREGGEANEGVSGWDRGLVRGTENPTGGGPAGPSGRYHGLRLDQRGQRRC
jgi:hypothetical protein